MDRKLDKDAFSFYYSELQEHIKGLKSSYPSDYQRVDIKTLPVISCLSYLANSKVIDIGSNFGMFSLLMSSIASEVLGLERSSDIYAISNEVKAFFSTKGFALDNVRFINKSLKEIQNHTYDSLLMTLVLYHLDNDEIDLLVEDAKRKCDRAIIQCRPGRGVEYHKGKLTDHVSRNDRFDGLYDIAGNIRFLKAIGMKRIKVTVSEELFGTEVFPVLIAERQ
jgi:SAM-dependent methyltransferase